MNEHPTYVATHTVLICRVILGTFSRRKKSVLWGGKYRICFYWVQAIYDLAIVTIRKVRVGTEFTYGQMRMCAEDSPANNQTPNTLQRDRPQHDGPATCVIAQQYSSATIIVLCVHSRKKKNRRAFQSSCYFALSTMLNPLNAELNHICCLLALLGAHLIFHVSRIMVKHRNAPQSYFYRVRKYNQGKERKIESCSYISFNF